MRRAWGRQISKILKKNILLFNSIEKARRERTVGNLNMNSLGRKTHLNFFVKAAFKFKRRTFNHILLGHLKFALKTPLIFAFLRAPARCCSRRRWLRPAAPSRPGRRAAGSARRRRCWPPGGSPPRPRRQSSGTGSGSSKCTKSKGGLGEKYV